MDLCILNDPDFEIHQIKLKFGGIRFYVNSSGGASPSSLCIRHEPGDHDIAPNISFAEYAYLLVQNPRAEVIDLRPTQATNLKNTQAANLRASTPSCDL